MEKYDFTIIIPHYNTPDLLMRCLASIPVREYIQVIVIDDCSPNSDDYLERYPELHRPYLEYYKTPHGGSAGRARNVGLEHAKGRWLIFMDADDLFVDNMEAILMESVNRSEDILFYNYKSVYNNDINKEAHRNFFKPYFSAIKYKENLFRYNFDPLWGKIIKRDMVEKRKIKFDECRYGNDLAFSFKCGVYAEAISIIDKPLFIITEREGSLSSSDFSKEKISINECVDRLEGGLRIQQFLIDHKLKINKNSYILRSEIFLKEYPMTFIKYYFFNILIKYPKIGYKLPFLLVTRTCLKPIKQLLRFVYKKKLE